MKKKGSVGKAALIYGIILCCVPLFKIFFANNTSDIATLINTLIRLITIVGALPGIVLGIVGIATKSDTTKSVIGLLLSIFGPFLTNLIAIVIISLIK